MQNLQQKSLTAISILTGSKHVSEYFTIGSSKTASIFHFSWRIMELTTLLTDELVFFYLIPCGKNHRYSDRALNLYGKLLHV